MACAARHLGLIGGYFCIAAWHRPRRMLRSVWVGWRAVRSIWRSSGCSFLGSFRGFRWPRTSRPVPPTGPCWPGVRPRNSAPNDPKPRMAGSKESTPEAAPEIAPWSSNRRRRASHPKRRGGRSAVPIGAGEDGDLAAPADEGIEPPRDRRPSRSGDRGCRGVCHMPHG